MPQRPSGLPRRRDVLAGAAAAFAPGLAAAQGSSSLGALATARNVVFGMAVTAGQLRESADLARIAAVESRMIVPGMDLKWSVVHPSREHFAFAGADAVMDFAGQRGLLARGHTLLWHEALPPWVAEATTAPEMTALLGGHIRAVAGRYAGRMHSWDVVNEVIEPGQNLPLGLRASPFLRAMGPEFIERAFAMAREADPGALLTINEYDLEMDVPWQARRRQVMLELLNRLVRRNVPVQALGIQGHLYPGRQPFDPAVFRRFLRDVASLGLQVFITEMDVVDRLLPATIAERDRLMAQATQDYLEAALAEPSVRLVVTWGVSDRYTWVNDNPLFRRTDGRPARPHLYDDGFRPKPVHAAVVNAFRAAPDRPAP